MSPRPSTSALSVPGNWAQLLVGLAVSVPWSVCALRGEHPADGIVALLAGLSILGAAFLLSWAVETAELDLPQSLAVSVLALVAVLPEYAVDATFAWKAAHDPSQAGYAIANMTGGNRLLLGLGWSTLVLVAWLRFGKKAISLPDNTRVDVAVLLLASLYALVPVARGSLTLVDTAVFVGMYALYVVAAARTGTDSEDNEDEHDPSDLPGPSALLAALPDWPRRGVLVLVLVWSAGVIFLAAEPFAEALVHSGKALEVDEFLLVQWVAPLASEAPEFAVACLLVLRGQLAKGMLTLVSSKVNQWTLLVGTLPVVTSLSGGEARLLQLDSRQAEEVMLTAAQSFFGVAVLANLKLDRAEAGLLAFLFVGQLFVPSTDGRFWFAAAYLVAATLLIVLRRNTRSGLRTSLGYLAAAARGRT